MVQEFWKQRDIEVESRRREHEIKVDIVSKMDETINHQLSKALSIASPLKKIPTEEEQNTEVENIKNWYFLEAKGIESKLNIYFPETELGRRWDYYARILNEYIMALFLYLIESDKQKAVKSYSDHIIEYIISTGNKKYEEDGVIKRLTSNFNTGSEQASDLMGVFWVEAGNIQRDIMKTRINIF